MYLAGLWLAALAAAGYTFATFFLKAALAKGARAGHLNLWSNVSMAVIVQPIWLFEDPGIPNAPLWLPLITCCTFFLGQVFTFAALARGDVSVATPVLGTKIIWVTALNALVFSVPVPVRWWFAAVAASLGVAVIAGGTPHGERRAMVSTAAFSLLAALCFSVTDVLVQRWAGGNDPLAFLPAMFGMVGIFSVGWYLVFERRAFLVKRAMAGPLSAGAGLLGLQCALVFLSLAWTLDATAANVVYSIRSLLTVGLAWMAGRFFGLREAGVVGRVVACRAAGALLLFGAILLIVWR